MALSPELVDKFMMLFIKKYDEHLKYEAAEQQLRELSDLVRITASKHEVMQDD